ncbi:hypothetical protein TcBrA4_0051680 [Trypanosoma cruzi]|nr:hypothetical protein TcBrA4_0051680 [Trypanosoma cruzi]
MGGAMQRKLDDAEAEPLLQQCRKMASDMEALRRSEQRYRALVGDDDAGDRCADPRTLRRARSACTVSSLRWLPLAWRRVRSQRQRPS